MDDWLVIQMLIGKMGAMDLYEVRGIGALIGWLFLPITFWKVLCVLVYWFPSHGDDDDLAPAISVLFAFFLSPILWGFSVCVAAALWKLGLSPLISLLLSLCLFNWWMLVYPRAVTKAPPNERKYPSTNTDILLDSLSSTEEEEEEISRRLEEDLKRYTGNDPEFALHWRKICFQKHLKAVFSERRSRNQKLWGTDHDARLDPTSEFYDPLKKYYKVEIDNG